MADRPACSPSPHLMRIANRLRQLHVLRLSVVRFGIVALVGEALYFFLYALFLSLTGNTATTLALAGGLCIVVNAYSHSRITFRVEFSWGLLMGYLLIQLLGFALAFLLGLALEKAGASQLLIAFATYAIWASLSYLLTRLLYRTKRPTC